MDFVLYGERGLHAIEVKSAARIRDVDLQSLRLFHADYPIASCWYVYGGTKAYRDGDIRVTPVSAFLDELSDLF